nr:DNA-directed DNA polymerase [Tanacetum cinerariifolium]
NGDLPVPDLRTMDELCQPSLNGRGGPITPIAIQATNFGLKNDMIQQSIKVNRVTDNALRLYLFPHSLTHHATAWFDRLPRNSINTFEQMAKNFLGKYFRSSEMKSPTSVNVPMNSFYNGLTLKHRDTINATAGETFMKRRPEECYDLIENMNAHHNDWDTLAQRSKSSSSITSFDTEIAALKAEMAEINKNLMRVLQVNQQVKAVTPNYETCGGPHSYTDSPATVGQTHNVHATGAYQGNSYQPQGNRNLLSYRSDNYLGPPGFNQNQNQNNQNQNFQNQNRNQGNIQPHGNNQGRKQFFQGASHGQNPPPAYQAPAYQAPGYQALVHQPLIPQPQVVTTSEFTNFMKANDSILKNMQTNMTSLTNSNLELKNMFGQFMKMNTASFSGLGTLPCNTITNPKEDLKVKHETEVTKDTVPPTNNGSTKYVQPLVVQTETPILNFKPVATPVSAPKPSQKPSIPYPSRLHDQKLRDKANDQKEKIFQIFQDLNFNISFADALILMPKSGPTIKTLLTNKDKLSELARTPLNEHCSAVLLKKLPEKLGDPGKFLIMCDFSGMDECLALTDLNASINLMPLSVWNNLLLPELSPTCMTLELADRSISRPVEVAEDVFVKVGTFNFSANFVVVDFDADPRVPLILGRSFLKTERALIDVFEGELTLCVGNEAITFNLNQTSRYSANYNDMMANRIDVIDMACEEYSQEVLGFSDVIAKVDAFLALEDDPTSPEVDHSYFNPEGDILLLEAFLNDDPSLPLPIKETIFLKFERNLKFVKLKPRMSLPRLNLKTYLPISNTYFWKEDFEPAVHHQRRVNLKIHDVIKKEGGFTVVENEENELILTRLVTGWRVCIDYRKLNEATRKDHFPLPSMDQMLERLARNETFSYRRMHFGLCNAPSTFQRCMMAIFHDMIEKTMKVSMDDFSVFGNSFQTCLSHLEKMLKQCEDTNLCLNWEKSHFMVKEGIVLSHKISKNGIEVNKAKVDVIAKLPHPTTIKGIRSFLGHAGFYRQFIQDFSKIARSMTHLLEKDTPSS